MSWPLPHELDAVYAGRQRNVTPGAVASAILTPEEDPLMADETVPTRQTPEQLAALDAQLAEGTRLMVHGRLLDLTGRFAALEEKTAGDGSRVDRAMQEIKAFRGEHQSILDRLAAVEVKLPPFTEPPAPRLTIDDAAPPPPPYEAPSPLKRGRDRSKSEPGS